MAEDEHRRIEREQCAAENMMPQIENRRGTTGERRRIAHTTRCKLDKEERWVAASKVTGNLGRTRAPHTRRYECNMICAALKSEETVGTKMLKEATGS